MTEGQTAKMADFARKLPKWQAVANLVPNIKKILPANMAK